MTPYDHLVKCVKGQEISGDFFLVFNSFQKNPNIFPISALSSEYLVESKNTFT